MFTLLGIHREAEDDLAELMPYCFLLSRLDCFCIKIGSIFKKRKDPSYG
jgi:hypothetical protein